jgi:hypothetical protein
MKARTGYDWTSPEEIKSLLASRGYEDIVVSRISIAPEYTCDEIVASHIGHLLLSLFMRHFSPEFREKWGEKVLPALKEHWGEMFGEGGTFVSKMEGLVTTARKPKA